MKKKGETVNEPVCLSIHSVNLRPYTYYQHYESLEVLIVFSDSTVSKKVFLYTCQPSTPFWLGSGAVWNSIDYSIQLISPFLPYEKNTRQSLGLWTKR